MPQDLDFIPVWVIFVGTIVIVLLAMEVGYRLGHAALRRSPDEKESPVSAMAGAVLGLAAFVLAFTFGIVSDRYDSRKGLVRQEANAIGTAALRTDFLPEPERGEAKLLFKKYVDLRLEFARSTNRNEKTQKHFLTETTQIQNRLWNLAVTNARKDMNSDVAALYINSLNEVIDIQALRVAVGIQARVPAGIWAVLYLITTLGMIGMGYQTGIAGSKRSMARPILALSFSLVFMLIASLDSSAGSFIKVSQQPLIDLRDSMSSHSGGGTGQPLKQVD